MEGEEKRLGEGRDEVCVCVSEWRLGVAVGEEEEEEVCWR